MSSLEEIQRRVATAVMQPLTREENMRRSAKAEAEALIKPNKVLTSFERLEIYNRQYWFRVLSCFTEDFPGLRAIVGARQFEGLMRAYLADCPSISFTLRNLGSRLEAWLITNPKWIRSSERLALDMVRLEWAHIEAFDGAFEPVLTPAEIEAEGLELRVALQPYVRLLELAYPVDDLLIEVHDSEGGTDVASNAARLSQLRKRVRHYAKPEPEPIYLAVHRLENSVYYKRLSIEAFRMLEALRERASLEQAIDRAFENSSLPEAERLSGLQQWFGNWAQLGWFCRPGRN
ncbi:MAG TPA: DNA-binding domain-containing protein [Bryobacteraceae bacterium]